MGTTRFGAQAPQMQSMHGAATAALGRRIHDLRSARGFSLQEFALLAGLTAPMMSALERGDENTPLVALVAAADALDLPLANVVADPATATVSSPAAAPIAHAVEAEDHAAPRGYVPLEMPELWEPPAGTDVGDESAPVPTAALPVPTRPAPRGPIPRTFADLRKGVLAGRTFATLPEFAVAAVVEAGQPVPVVASIFRVPSWRLEAWVQGGVATPPAPTPFRRSR